MASGNWLAWMVVFATVGITFGTKLPLRAKTTIAGCAIPGGGRIQREPNTEEAGVKQRSNESPSVLGYDRMNRIYRMGTD